MKINQDIILFYLCHPLQYLYRSSDKGRQAVDIMSLGAQTLNLNTVFDWQSIIRCSIMLFAHFRLRGRTIKTIILRKNSACSVNLSWKFRFTIIQQIASIENYKSNI